MECSSIKPFFQCCLEILSAYSILVVVLMCDGMLLLFLRVDANLIVLSCLCKGTVLFYKIGNVNEDLYTKIVYIVYKLQNTFENKIG